MKKIFSIIVVVLAILSNVASAADIDYVDWLDAGYTQEGKTIESQLRHEAAINQGRTMENKQEGCTEAAVMLGSKVSPILAAAKEAGVVYNPTLIGFAQKKGAAVVSFDESKLEAGDVIFFGTMDDPLHHAMLYIGHGMMAGNNSYLYGKEGNGGIWMLKVSDYSVYAPQLILKTGAHIVGLHDAEHHAMFTSIHEGAVRDCAYADTTRTGLMLALTIAVIIRILMAMFTSTGSVRTVSEKNAVAEPEFCSVACMVAVEAADADVVVDAAEDNQQGVLCMPVFATVHQIVKAGACIYNLVLAFIRWITGPPPLLQPCLGMT